MTALDIIYGRQGGRRLPTQSPDQIDATLRAAIDAGTIIPAACLCTTWLLAAKDVGSPCTHCGRPMKALT